MVQRQMRWFGFCINIWHIGHSPSITVALLATCKFYLPIITYFLLTWRTSTLSPPHVGEYNLSPFFLTWHHPTLCLYAHWCQLLSAVSPQFQITLMSPALVNWITEEDSPSTSICLLEQNDKLIHSPWLRDGSGESVPSRQGICLLGNSCLFMLSLQAQYCAKIASNVIEMGRFSCPSVHWRMQLVKIKGKM